MAVYYLYPDGTTSAGASWGPTGAATIHQAIDDLVDANDGNTTYAQGSAISFDYFICTLAPMVDVVSISSITAHCWYNNAGGGANQEVDFGIRIGSVNYVNGGIPVSSSTYLEATKTWTLNPATSAPWTKPQLDDLSIVGGTQDAGFKPIDSVRITSLFISVEYQPIPAGLAAAREIASQRLRRYRRPLEEAQIDVGLDKLDLELMDDLSIVHFAGPHASGLGWGLTNWKRRLHQLREESLDLNAMQMRIGTRGRRGYLCTFWDTAESRRSASAAEDGVARLTTGGTLSYERNSKAWIPDPGSQLVTEIGINQKPVAYNGLLIENFASNFLQHSSCVEGATSVAGLTLAGTGVNGSSIAASASAGNDPLFDSAVTTNTYFFTAGTPHAADLTATWPATASLTNEKMRFSIDHRDTAGETLTWRLQRSVDSNYWNDSTSSWGAGVTNNVITSSSTRARFYSNVIATGAGATTLTLMLRVASGGTSGRLHRVYHVQLEQNAWATSHVVTTASTYARAVQLYHIDNVSGKRNISSTNGTFLCEFIPDWNSADMVAISGFPCFFDMTYDASNWIRMFWNSGTTTLDFEMRAAGTTYSAKKTWTPVRGTTYKLAARWTSSAGELGLTARTLSVFVDGVKGTDATRAADPTQSSVDLYIGGDPVNAMCNGNIRKILFTQEVYTDEEIARFIS